MWLRACWRSDGLPPRLRQGQPHGTLAGTIRFAGVVLVALAVWVGIDVYNVSEAFPCLESIYCGANIGAILFAWNFARMGVLEIACRWGEEIRGDRGTILTLVPFVPIPLFLLVVCLLSIEGGAAYFNMILDGYRVLFRN